MKIYQINGGVFGSTGKIMFGIAKTAQEHGHTVRCASPVTSTNRNREPEEAYYHIGSYYGRCFSVLLARLTGLEGCFAFRPTWQLLRDMEAFHPDVVHLHSIHNSYLNIPMLFRWLKKRKVKVVWTLHDCWAFTGHCPYFDMAKCGKWKSGCRKCPQYREYPASFVDNAKYMYSLKKKWFLGLEDLTLVTPSRWLADLVRESFLKEYSVQVVHNGIDLDVFRPRESDFRKKHHCEDKHLLLGVAFDWGARKGLDIFAELAKRLDDRYQIVLVGTDENADRLLPENVISIHRTQNQTELAEIYTAADVFVNPTREDNYPTVNMEAIACGTPVVTFRTGGSPEMVARDCGLVVDCEDVDALEAAVGELSVRSQKMRKSCLEKAEDFEMHKCFEEIVVLYGINKNQK